ncbi:NADH-ubiquinone oxidoreductase-F iron-sulfur binding region domain-containing protein [Mycobacterium sp. shizuoka-1]|uniref:NADH-ubiquinone oxidoreductase-F iron-sulfur binding region domain-containing protein n=1 Tax=Mycobacterium sp. shizuoka-1 TaxID=2039281 RepID=UPI000C05F82F|nr:NADH-ubiquinone oxidoreductase-F iron-sulfur binding region domain-containing protein [Mycobacterium sp. shizuoka-1]GAY19375.1 NADH dehydrogenase [Mycobacterium sp. shizuoka-1]
MNATAPPGTALRVAAAPGCVPRLLRLPAAAENHSAYLAAGGYGLLDNAESLLADVESSGVLGRGGAAFPLAVKLRTVRAAHTRGHETVVVANGEEGEPASVKDRWLLRHRPHLVLDGVRLAARLVGAQRAYVYVSDQDAARIVDAALAEVGFDTFGGLAVSIVTVAPGYVAGEETAAVRAINGGPAKPTDKPPRPFQHGVAGHPTLVSNVETLANLPYLQRHGAVAFRSAGTAASPGTFLATVTGAGRPPALYEIPHGMPFTDLLALHGVSPDKVQGALMGGYFAGLLNRGVLDTTLDHETFRQLGCGLGCGAIAILTDDCPVAVAAAVLAYFDRENAGQCGSCFNGTAAMAAAAGALRDGVAIADDIARLRRWSVVLRGRGACATLDGAANVAASLLAHFPHVVEQHLAGACDPCRSATFSAQRPYEVEAVTQP